MDIKHESPSQLMEAAPQGGWTFATILAHMYSIIYANDRRYLELFQSAEKATGIAMVAAEKAIAAAMVAAEKAVNAALAASDKAVGKAEESQLRVNLGQNEFRQQLKDQASTLASKETTDNLDARLQLVEKALANTAGSSERMRENSSKNQWSIGIVIGIAFGLLAATMSLISLLKK